MSRKNGEQDLNVFLHVTLWPYLQLEYISKGDNIQKMLLLLGVNKETITFVVYLFQRPS